MSYQDVLHIYGISRAGYVPQLFSIRLPNPEVIQELLYEANAKALVLAPEFAAMTTSFRLPVCLAQNKDGMCMSEALLQPIVSSGNGDQVVFIFHTSGSTSGRPKLVPCNQRWLQTTVDKAKFVTTPQDPRRKDVTVFM